jgi:hypothetical protein
MLLGLFWVIPTYIHLEQQIRPIQGWASLVLIPFLAPQILLLPGYRSLPKENEGAWRYLVTMTSLIFLAGTAIWLGDVFIGNHFNRLQTDTHSILISLIPGFAMISSILNGLIPLLFLLTDRPSDWDSAIFRLY